MALTVRSVRGQLSGMLRHLQYLSPCHSCSYTTEHYNTGQRPLKCQKWLLDNPYPQHLVQQPQLCIGTGKREKTISNRAINLSLTGEHIWDCRAITLNDSFRQCIIVFSGFPPHNINGKNLSTIKYIYLIISLPHFTCCVEMSLEPDTSRGAAGRLHQISKSQRQSGSWNWDITSQTTLTLQGYACLFRRKSQCIQWSLLPRKCA